ncbi:MAG: YdhR family protein [Bacteroidetes bacterium]|nr:YdhR family protein [Bacteroidota bacterium]
MKNAEAVLAVKFQSAHSAEELMKTCVEDLDDFRNVPGLIEKYYLLEEVSGAISGFYIFKTKAAREAFWKSDLAKNIITRYKVVVDSLRVERYDVQIALNGVMVS